MKAIIIGIILIGVIIYADSQYFESGPSYAVDVLDVFQPINLTEATQTLIKSEPVVQPKDCTEPPYFKTFPEELSWYTQCEPTLMIEESNCDKLVTKYRAGTTQDKINYSFRILELCEV